MEDIKTKLKEQIEFKVKAVSVKNLGICNEAGKWYNIEKGLDDKTKQTIENILGDIYKGDTAILKLNDKGNFFYVYKVKSKPEERKITSKDVPLLDNIVKEKGDIWQKCLLTILSKLPSQEEKMTPEFLDAILPSTNSLFIETNKTLRERR